MAQDMQDAHRSARAARPQRRGNVQRVSRKSGYRFSEKDTRQRRTSRKEINNMTTHVQCGSFFAGNQDTEHKDWTLVIGDDGNIAYVGPTAQAPLPGPKATVIDHSNLFVMPGMIDVH